MKKVITLILLLSFAAALAGCGAPSPSAGGAKPDSAAGSVTGTDPAGTAQGGADYAVPETYQAVWRSNTGKTVINVDAAVEAAAGANYPLVSAKVGEISEAQTRALADLLFGKDGYRQSYDGLQADSDKGRELAFEALEKTGEGYSAGNLYLTTGYHGDIVTNSSLNYRRFGTEYSYSENMPVWQILSGGDISGSAYSYSEAERLATGVRDVLDTQLVNISCGAIHGEKYTGKEDNSTAAPVDAYIFNFTRSVGTVPVTYEYSTGGAVDEMDDLTVWNSNFERLTVVVSDDGVVGVQYENPCLLADSAEACTLTAFDELMEVAASMFPLKFAYIEQGTPGCEISIDRIALGYMRVQSRNQPGSYVMTPVLDFFGTLKRTLPDGMVVCDDFKYVSQLTLSAVDGTVIDREYGY